MDTKNTDPPKTNFQILIPHANKIIVPNITILNAVPKSGCRTTRINGRKRIKKGNIKLIILFIS